MSETSASLARGFILSDTNFLMKFRLPSLCMSFVLRLADHSDVSALQQLIPLSVRELSREVYTTDQIESAIVHIFGVDTQLIDDQTYFVVEASGVMVGCGGWSKRKTLFGGDQTKATTVDSLLDPAIDAARIRAFFVHPDWKRQGIGRLIITACESAAIQAGFRRFELVATLPGEPLYVAMGYCVTNRFEIPMPDGNSLPASRMIKEL